LRRDDDDRDDNVYATDVSDDRSDISIGRTFDEPAWRKKKHPQSSEMEAKIDEKIRKADISTLPCPFTFYGVREVSGCKYSHDNLSDASKEVVDRVIAIKTVRCPKRRCVRAKCPFKHIDKMNFRNKQKEALPLALKEANSVFFCTLDKCDGACGRVHEKETKDGKEMKLGRDFIPANCDAHMCVFPIHSTIGISKTALNATIVSGALYYIHHDLQKDSTYTLEYTMPSSSSSGSSGTSAREMLNTKDDVTVAEHPKGKLKMHKLAGDFAKFAQGLRHKLSWGPASADVGAVLVMQIPEKSISNGTFLNPSYMTHLVPSDYGSCGAPIVDERLTKVYGIHCWGSQEYNGCLRPGYFADTKNKKIVYRTKAELASLMGDEYCEAAFFE
jgi:hypothetical protein